QDASDALDGLHNAGNRAEREGADNRVDGGVLQWNSFAREVQKFDVQVRSAPVRFCEPDHPGVGFERVKLGHFLGVVESEVYAGAYADLKHCPLSPRNDPLANLSDGLRVAQHAYQMRIDMVSVKRHGHLLSARSAQGRSSAAGAEPRRAADIRREE